MLGMKNHFDISGSIEIREVDIAGVACILLVGHWFTLVVPGWNRKEMQAPVSEQQS